MIISITTLTDKTISINIDGVEGFKPKALLAEGDPITNKIRIMANTKPQIFDYKVDLSDLSIDGVIFTDIKDAVDAINTKFGNFNKGGGAPGTTPTLDQVVQQGSSSSIPIQVPNGVSNSDTVNVGQLNTAVNNLQTSSDAKYQLKGNYSVVGHTHLATEITTDVNNRFVSDADKTKWNALKSNVQADWNATTGDAVILNKPTNLATKQDIDNINIGGRNYILNNPVYKTLDYNTLSISNYFNSFVIPNDSLTFSFYITISDPSLIRGDLYLQYEKLDGSVTGISAPFNSLITTNLNNKRIIVQFTLPNDYKKLNLAMFVILGTCSYIYIEKLQLEKGNKVTDWTPAPEDINPYVETSVITTDIAATPVNIILPAYTSVKSIVVYNNNGVPLTNVELNKVGFSNIVTIPTVPANSWVSGASVFETGSTGGTTYRITASGNTATNGCKIRVYYQSIL